MTNRVGQQLGNYRLEKLLGEGGFAEVYLGEHVTLKQKRAIKVLRTALTEQERLSFRVEAQRLASLTHSHIIPILDFDEREGFPYLVMSYAPNGSLRDRHPKGTRISLSTVIEYVKQIASALQYIHNQKLIHRDVKPENMLLGLDNAILLSDVGIAVVAHSEYSQRTQIATGTPYYMAPEQFRGKAEPASDQYSLGVIVYEWLSGTTPFFEGDSLQLGFQHAFEPPPPLSEKLSTVPADVEKVVMTALAKKPQERFMNVQAFTNALENAGGIKPKQPITPLHSAVPNMPPSKSALAQAAVQPVKKEPVITPSPQKGVTVTPPSTQFTPSATIDKDAIYREGFIARAMGDLERAASLWQQVLNNDKNYGNGTLATQLQKLSEEMHQRQIQTLRRQAKDAQRAGDWRSEQAAWNALLRLYSYDNEAKTRLSQLNEEQRRSLISALRIQVKEARQRGMQEQEIALLKELLQLDPQDKDAYKHFEVYYLSRGKEARKNGDWALEISTLTEFIKFASPEIKGKIDFGIRDAKHNQEFVWMYKNVVQLVREGNLDAAKLLLKEVWFNAPNYGDPAQVARILGMHVP